MRSHSQPRLISAAFDYSSGVLGRLELIFSFSSNLATTIYYTLGSSFCKECIMRCALLSTDFVIITKHSVASDGNVMRAFKRLPSV
jgi:hypothetical protein